jgi:hypothetical protein
MFTNQLCAGLLKDKADLFHCTVDDVDRYLKDNDLVAFQNTVTLFL